MPEDDESPGLSFGQALGILIRGRWWILTSICVASIGAIAFAYRLPDRYTSEATLLVVQQQVPAKYVTPTSTLGIAEELQAMTQEVLSRKRLTALIEQFNLYPRERQRLAPEQVIALMQKYIDIAPIEGATSNNNKDINAFKLSFSADKAVVAQAVTSQLTSLFIQENLKIREDQATTTTTFLQEHLEAARKQLEAQEERLRDFKMQNLGELPEQQAGNLAILSSTQMQLQSTTSNLDRARQQRVYLESLLSGYQRMNARTLATIAPAGPGQPVRTADPIQTAQNDLARLQASLAQLKSVYSDRHPDVITLQTEIASKQKTIESLKAAATGNCTAELGERSQADDKTRSKTGSADGAGYAGDIQTDPAIAQVQSQLEANRVEIENLMKDEKQQRAAVAQYQSRINMTPVREQQLTGILRDYELSKQEYLDLLGKEQQSQLAMSLEKRQGGQQFRLAEAPSLPTLPSSPNRSKIALGGVAGGLVLGLALAILAEFRNLKVYTEAEVSRRFSIPLVVGLPLLLTAAEERRRTWRHAFEWVCGSGMAMFLAVAEYYVYRHP